MNFHVNFNVLLSIYIYIYNSSTGENKKDFHVPVLLSVFNFNKFYITFQ